MFKLILYALTAILIIAFVGQLSINFSPFKITMARPVLAIGGVLFFIGGMLISTSNYNQGRLQGHDDAIEIIRKHVKENTETVKQYPNDSVDIMENKVRSGPWPKLRLLFRKQIIYGCEARGDGGAPYLTRYTLIDGGTWQLCIHVFHRSDNSDDLHDHPWNFASLILWGGYIEETPQGKTRYYPGSILFRRAEHIHRVQLLATRKASQLEKKYERLYTKELDYVKRRRAVTLVVMGERRRTWGFWEPMGNAFAKSWQFTDFVSYFRKNRC